MKHKQRCSDVTYRQGVIEVTSGIHDGFVNLELWNIHPDFEISSESLCDIPEEQFTGNCEIEMNLAQAEALANAILGAVDSIRDDR